MQDTASRDEAFLSGFAQHVFQEDLPEELTMWMVDERVYFFPLMRPKLTLAFQFALVRVKL